MTETDKEQLIRQYAAGEITWRALRSRGIESYLDVLAGLGRLGLRPPMAPMEGAERRGSATRHRALASGARRHQAMTLRLGLVPLVGAAVEGNRP